MGASKERDVQHSLGAIQYAVMDVDWVKYGTYSPNSTPEKIKPPATQKEMQSWTVMLAAAVDVAARVRAVEISVKHPTNDQFPGRAVGLLWRESISFRGRTEGVWAPKVLSNISMRISITAEREGRLTRGRNAISTFENERTDMVEMQTSEGNCHPPEHLCPEQKGPRSRWQPSWRYRYNFSIH